MSPTSWLVAGSVASWVVATAATGPGMGREMLAGMLGPLVVTVVSWEMAHRTFRRNPERLMPLMVKAFAGKMVFFGAYVAVILSALSFSPVPFVVSFTTYFIALHLAEALCLRRLFAETTRDFR